MAELPDVITGEVIDADAWGNPIRDRTVQRYADDAERDALNPAPVSGDLALVQTPDDGTQNILQVYKNGAWHPVALQSIGPVFTAGVDVGRETVTTNVAFQVRRSTGAGNATLRVSMANSGDTVGYASMQAQIGGVTQASVSIGDQEVKVEGSAAGARVRLVRTGSAYQWRFAIGSNGDMLLQSSPDGSSWTTQESWAGTP